jgi:hypothetical protein
MAETLTDVDQFDADIQWPVASELASAADVRDRAIQRLANRTRYAYNRLSNNATIAQYTPSASALADGSALTLTAYLGYPSGAWTLASNEITVPSVGVYRATLNLAVEVASATNPLAANIYLMSGAAGVLAWIVGNRFNATAADSFKVSGSAIFAITNTATQKIWLRNESSANITTSSAGGDEEMLHSFIIERIGDAS